MIYGTVVRSGIICMIVGQAATAAAEKQPDVSRTVDALSACRTLTEDARRLACFDRAVPAILAAREDGTLLVLDKEKVVERRRARFGLASDGAALGDAADKATAVRELTTTISSVAGAQYSRFNLALADGSVWQTVETARFEPRAGAAITIKAAALGAYKASIAGGTSIKVKRLR
jgi:hypothetical protein